MKYRLIIFDLDGTLLNTIGDLTDSVNYSMRFLQFPEHTEEEVLSPSTRNKDILLKSAKYHNAGVREYWIADPMHETVTTFDFRRNDIVMKMYTFEDKVPVGIYDNQFTIDFKEIRDSYAFLDDAEEPE